jgi:hypothetical protein
MRWVTIKTVTAPRASKTANKNFIDVPKKPSCLVRAQAMLADAPPEMRLPRAALAFFRNGVIPR